MTCLPQALRSLVREEELRFTMRLWTSWRSEVRSRIGGWETSPPLLTRVCVVNRRVVGGKLRASLKGVILVPRVECYVMECDFNIESICTKAEILIVERELNEFRLRKCMSYKSRGGD